MFMFGVSTVVTIALINRGMMRLFFGKSVERKYGQLKKAERVSERVKH